MSKVKKITALLCMVCVLFVSMAPGVKAEAAAVKLNRTEVSIVCGESAKLKVKGTTNKVTWISDNKIVATVNSSVKVTAKENGTAKVYAVVAKMGKILSCKVTVEEKTAVSTPSLSPLYSSKF